LTIAGHCNEIAMFGLKEKNALCGYQLINGPTAIYESMDMAIGISMDIHVKFVDIDVNLISKATGVTLG